MPTSSRAPSAGVKPRCCWWPGCTRCSTTPTRSTPCRRRSRAGSARDASAAGNAVGRGVLPGHAGRQARHLDPRRPRADGRRPGPGAPAAPAVGAGAGAGGQGLLRAHGGPQDPRPHPTTSRLRRRAGRGVRGRTHPVVPVRGAGGGQREGRRPGRRRPGGGGRARPAVRQPHPLRRARHAWVLHPRPVRDHRQTGRRRRVPRHRARPPRRHLTRGRATGQGRPGPGQPGRRCRPPARLPTVARHRPPERHRESGSPRLPMCPWWTGRGSSRR